MLYAIRTGNGFVKRAHAGQIEVTAFRNHAQFWRSESKAQASINKWIRQNWAIEGEYQIQPIRLALDSR